MTIERTIKIPANRRLIVDLPGEVPLGATARFELTWFPQTALAENSAKPRESLTPCTDRLAGCLAHLGDISLEEIREERLGKYR